METIMMHGSQALSIGLAQCFVSTFWQGTALAVLVGLGLWATPRTNASTRFAIWLTTFSVLALLPLGVVVAGFASAGSSASLVGSAAPRLRFDLDLRWAWVIALLWVCGSLYHATSLVLNGFRLHALLKASTVVDEGELDPQLRATLLISSHKVELHLSDRVNAPCAVGFFRPAIVIPRWLWTRLTVDELRQIVVHETAHLRRRDDWTNLLQKLALAVFPLNPALYWIERRLCREREIACDDAVLATTVSPVTYAACLAGLAEKKLVRRSASLAPGAWSRQSELLLRVQGILNRKRNASTRVARGLATGFIAAAAGGAFFLAQSPQIVSFVATQPVQYAANAPLRGNLNLYPASPNHAAFQQTAFTVPAHNGMPGSYKVPAASHRATPHPIARRDVAKPAQQPAIAPSQPPVYQEVGILQSPATGRTWVVLSVWRPSPAQQQVSGNAGNSANTAIAPVQSPAASAVQTGWLLIRI